MNTRQFLTLLIFALCLTRLPSRAEIELNEIIPFGSTWQWFNNGSVDPGTTTPGFHSSWFLLDSPNFDNSGPAPIGYGIIAYTPIKTDIGTPASGSRFTTYFKKSFTLPTTVSKLYVQLLADDGAFVYLDGVLAARANVPPVDGYFIFANDTVRTEETTSYHALPEKVYAAGSHTIAVSVHNARNDSSDLGFDLRLYTSVSTTTGRRLWGGNGHEYEVIWSPGGISWKAAKHEAVARGGHLVTISSAGEGSFVAGLITSPNVWYYRAYDSPYYAGPWIGLGQGPASSPTETWEWVTGEPVSLTDWLPGDPDDFDGIENGQENGVSYRGATIGSAGWSDSAGVKGGYVIEYGTPVIGSPQITDVRAVQRAGTKLVDVHYDLAGISGPYSVRLEGSVNGGATWTLSVASLSGDFGSSVAAGPEKHIVWNAGVDWINQFSDTIRFRFVVGKVALPATSTESALISVDTLSTLPSNLYLVGPVTLTSGRSASYRVMSKPSSEPAVDITTQSTLGFFGPAPAGTGIGGWTVFAGRISEAGSFQLRGRYASGAGQVFSAPLTVTIQPTLLLTLRTSLSGTPGNTSLTLQGTASGGLDPIAITWDTDADGAYDDASGANVTIPFNRPPRTYLVHGRAQDANGLVETGTVSVTLNAPPVLNEPPITKPKPDAQIGIGTLKDADGNPLVLDPAKASNGLVVITHGLDFYGTNNLSWMLGMASDIRRRCLREGKPEPQIILYEWPSNLSSSDNIDKRAQAILDSTEWAAAFQLFNDDGNFKNKLANAAYRKSLNQLAKLYLPAELAAKWTTLGPALLVAEFARGVAEIWPYAYDILAIRPRSEEYGRNLAGYIATQTMATKIDPHGPIHFIGHSAGGFLVAAAAANLKQWSGFNGKSFRTNAGFLVTTLDTPFPNAAPFISFSNPGRIERYITQLGGVVAGISFAPQLEQMFSWEDFNLYDRSTWVPQVGFHYRNRPGPPGRYYQRVQVPVGRLGTLLDFTEHAYAHAWYAATARGNEADRSTQGFYFSSLMGNRPFPGFESEGARLQLPRGVRDKREADDPLPDDVCLAPPTGVFGSAVAGNEGLALVENGNAGAYWDVIVPEFAYALGFSYHFTQAGDGDFLSVEIEGAERMASGQDTPLSREQFMSDAFDVSAFAGQAIRLVFRFVSRGQANARLSVKDICFKNTNDADGDGLRNADELTSRTDPYSPDTDFDGISDYDELNLYRTNPVSDDTDADGQSDLSEIRVGTDPLQGRSFFHIQRVERNQLNGALTLTWPTVPGRFYRVLRSERLDRQEFGVVGHDIQAAGDTLSFTLEQEALAFTTRFYWVECLLEP